MYYITRKSNPKEFSQISFDDFFSGMQKSNRFLDNYKYTQDTRTICCERIPPRYMEKESVDYLIYLLDEYNKAWKDILDADKSSLYYSFKIPKHSGGMRQIDAPSAQLKLAQTQLRDIFMSKFNALYHTCAFAYISGRSSLTAVQRHQFNRSRFFLKMDCHDFFGSTTSEFVMSQLAVIYPFNLVIEDARGKEILERALSVCFLNNKLPQGTPISPMLTNLIMIPIDYQIAKYIRDNDLKMVYTRYADDMIISRSTDFNGTWRKVQKDILEIFHSFNAPYTFNEKKTRYGSSAGRNWNLGLMLNKDNEITLGHKKKKELKVMLCSLLTHTEEWSASDAQSLQGTIAYHLHIEEDYTKKVIKDYESKYGNGRTVCETLKNIMNP